MQIQKSSAIYLRLVTTKQGEANLLSGGGHSSLMEILISTELRGRALQSGIRGGSFTIISYGFFASVTNIRL